MFNALYLTQKDGKTVAEIRPLKTAQEARDYEADQRTNW